MLKKILSSSILTLAASILSCQPVFAVIPDEATLDYFDNTGIYYYNPVGHTGNNCVSNSTKLSGADTAEKIWNFFIEQGFNDAQAAGILGNAMLESGLSPTISSSGSHWGLFQWMRSKYRDELEARITQAGLGQYLSSQYWNPGADDAIPEADHDKLVEIELTYLMETPDDEWRKTIPEADTPELAAEIFLTTFERAINGESPIEYYAPYRGALYQGTQKRREYAREFFDKYSGNGISISQATGGEEGQNLSIIGDSISVGAKNAFMDKFSYLSDSQIDAEVSRTWNQGLEVAQKTSLKDIVIFALGTNNPSPAVQQSDIDALLAITKDRTVVLTTNYGPAGYTENNELFRQLAKDNKNIIVADWEAAVSKDPSKYLSADKIHPNGDGAKLFVDTIYDAINGAFVDGCSVGDNFSDLVLAYAWPEYHQAVFVDRRPAYAEAVETSIREGRYVGGSVRGVAGIDCGGFVTILMQNSGLSPDYNSGRGGTSVQEPWVQNHNWIQLSDASNPIDPSTLQPGDVAFTDGHTFIFVGEIPGFESNIASASYGEDCGRAPMAGTEGLISNGIENVRWYRNPDYNPGNGGKTSITKHIAD